MVKVVFQETEAAHAARLGVSRNFVRVRRRALVERLGGPPAADQRGDNIPERVQRATLAELLLFLQVEIAPRSAKTSRGGVPVRLAPASSRGHHRGTRARPGARGTRAPRTACAWAGRGCRGGSSTHPMVTSARPMANSSPTPNTAPAVVEAFRLILACADQAGQVPWAAVAEALNQQGYRRRRGQPWRGDDVRDLTQVTTYAGYVRRNWRAAAAKRGRSGKGGGDQRSRWWIPWSFSMPRGWDGAGTPPGWPN